ncbi:hypothetical protein [Exiguobacterium sp. s16]|uniref:hypothetical protein n=1 Tax=Exiguobacterium sp. s16 TaxID=2751237 RepID=UPI001BEB362D|nr:hypothetical protein [Exiguobacterium sp. s16]
MKEKNIGKTKIVGYSLAILSFVWAFLSFFLSKYSGLSNLNFILITVILVIATILSFMIDLKNSEINDLREDIKNNIVGLLSSYDRLAKFESDERYNKIFEKFVNFEKQVIGVQTYSYSLSSSSFKNKIKIEYQNGYTEENHDINAIIQSYYSFQKTDLKIVDKSLKKLIIFSDSSRAQEYFLSKISQVKNHSFIPKEEHLALLSIVEENLTKHLDISLEDDLYNVIGVKRPSSKKRLGIAKAILSFEFFQISTAYSFGYSGNSKDKDDRRYLTYIVESYTGEKKLYLIVYRIENSKNQNEVSDLEEHILFSFKNFLNNNNLIEKRLNISDQSEWGLDSIAKKIRSNF